MTAENLAKQYGISRKACDGTPLLALLFQLTLYLAYALQSQQRYASGLLAGAFRSEIVPVPVRSRKDPTLFEADEHPRLQTSLASLTALPAVFIKETGVVTAGNASGICDGAAANVVMSESALARYGTKPLARIAGYAWSACEPEIMGIGPVVAVREALRKVGKGVGDMDIIELNEVGRPFQSEKGAQRV